MIVGISGKKRMNLSSRIGNLFARLILVMTALTVVFPLLWDIITSLKSNRKY